MAHTDELAARYRAMLMVNDATAADIIRDSAEQNGVSIDFDGIAREVADHHALVQRRKAAMEKVLSEGGSFLDAAAVVREIR